MQRAGSAGRDSNDDSGNRDVASRAQERSSCATRAALTLNRRCAVQFRIYCIRFWFRFRFVSFALLSRPVPPRTTPLSNCDLVTHRAQRLAASSLLLLSLLLVLSSRNSHTHRQRTLQLPLLAKLITEVVHFINKSEKITHKTQSAKENKKNWNKNNHSTNRKCTKTSSSASLLPFMTLPLLLLLLLCTVEPAAHWFRFVSFRLQLFTV